MGAHAADPRFTDHVDRLFSELERLFEAGEDARALLRAPGWEHVVSLLAAEVATIDRRLDGASEPLTQAQYALLHGRRDGARMAEEAVRALISRSERRLASERAKHEGAAMVPDRS